MFVGKNKDKYVDTVIDIVLVGFFANFCYFTPFSSVAIINLSMYIFVVLTLCRKNMNLTIFQFLKIIVKTTFISSET